MNLTLLRCSNAVALKSLCSKCSVAVQHNVSMKHLYSVCAKVVAEALVLWSQVEECGSLK